MKIAQLLLMTICLRIPAVRSQLRCDKTSERPADLIRKLANPTVRDHLVETGVASAGEWSFWWQFEKSLGKTGAKTLLERAAITFYGEWAPVMVAGGPLIEVGALGVVSALYMYESYRHYAAHEALVQMAGSHLDSLEKAFSDLTMAFMEMPIKPSDDHQTRAALCHYIGTLDIFTDSVNNVIVELTNRRTEWLQCVIWCGTEVPASVIDECSGIMGDSRKLRVWFATLKSCQGSCSEQTFFEFKSQVNKAMTGMCTHLQNAICDFPDNQEICDYYPSCSIDYFSDKWLLPQFLAETPDVANATWGPQLLAETSGAANGDALLVVPDWHTALRKASTKAEFLSASNALSIWLDDQYSLARDAAGKWLDASECLTLWIIVVAVLNAVAARMGKWEGNYRSILCFVKITLASAFAGWMFSQSMACSSEASTILHRQNFANDVEQLAINGIRQSNFEGLDPAILAMMRNSLESLRLKGSRQLSQPIVFGVPVFTVEIVILIVVSVVTQLETLILCVMPAVTQLLSSVAAQRESRGTLQGESYQPPSLPPQEGTSVASRGKTPKKEVDTSVAVKGKTPKKEFPTEDMC